MNAIIEFFHYFYVKGTFYLLIASFTMHAYGQNLSNEALHKVMTYKKLMSGSMSVKKENGIFIFSSVYKCPYNRGPEEGYIKHIPTRYLNLAYSDPHEGLDHGGPVNRITYEVSTDKIVIKIYDRVQLVCDFDDNGTEKAPVDPFSEFLQCKPGTPETIDGKIIFDNGDNLRTKIIRSCTHNKKHMQYIGATTYGYHKGKVREGRSINYYAPWQFSHNQTVTYNLNQIAKSLGITKRDLIYQLIENGVSGIVTDKGELYNYLSDNEKYYLVYSLWNLFGNQAELEKSTTSNTKQNESVSRNIILGKANHLFNAAKIAVENKQRKRAITILDTALVVYKEALEWSINDEQRKEVLQSYMSAFRTQTFNAYRLMNDDKESLSLFQRNYDYLNTLRFEAPVDWQAMEIGIGTIALEMKNYNDAICHLSLGLDEMNAPSSVMVKVKLLLAKAYLGAEMKQNAESLLDNILELDPDNSEVQNLKKQL